MGDGQYSPGLVITGGGDRSGRPFSESTTNLKKEVPAGCWEAKGPALSRVSPNISLRKVSLLQRRSLVFVYQGFRFQETSKLPAVWRERLHEYRGSIADSKVDYQLHL